MVKASRNLKHSTSDFQHPEIEISSVTINIYAMKQPNQKIAIVTGGGSGIGLAITEKFVANNILTVIVGRDEQKLKAAKEKLGELCVPVICDLSNLSAIPKMVEKVAERYGHIDIL